MAEVRSYRAKLYAKYATVQVPQWLQAAERANGVNNRAIAQRLHGWLPETKKASCLDLGCGAGDLLLALQALGFTDLVGVDGGPEQVAIAKSRGLYVVQSDILEYLSASDKTFDLILGFDIIEHFTKDEVLELLDLIRRRLNPGGSLILQTPNAMSPWAAHFRYTDLTHELIFSPSCLESILRLCGFKGFDIREVGPHVHGATSAVRWLLWKFIWAGYAILNCIESGGSNGGVYTRNMLVRVAKADVIEW